MTLDAGRRKGWLITVLLGAVTLAVFWPVRHCEFTNFDDPSYVTENEMVSRGLSAEGFAMAFRQPHGGNWHPLTSLSHMLDVSLFGLKPAGHHLVNLALHSLNAMLVFAVLRALTGSFWRSALVAGLFALHPMHVESVAWISERKDVLSGCFFLLTLLAYARYVSGEKIQQSKSRFWYALTLLCFALGLMSKPMLVTLPCVLLLLDLWPLRRMTWPVPWPQLRPLLVEKLPFILLTIASCVITYWIQSDAGATSEIPLNTRLARICIAYASYVMKLLGPIKLAVFYPLPKSIPWWELAGAVVFLVAISLTAWRALRRSPELAVGWLWFLGTLVPVIGLVQVGQQLMADRYTYLPSIGFFIAFVWTGAAFLQGFKVSPLATATACALWLGGLGFLTAKQITTWRNSEALYTHALAVTTDNHVAHNNLAALCFEQKRYEAAAHHAAEALRISPNYADAHLNYGNALNQAGKTAEARQHLERALELKPTPAAMFNLAKLFADGGETAQAEQLYRAALAQQPGLVDARYNLALLLTKVNRAAEAQTEFETVLRARPIYPGARLTLGALLAGQKRLDEAAKVLRQQIELVPGDADARYNLGHVYLMLDLPTDARAQFAEAVRLRPDDLGLRESYGDALFQEGQFDQAIVQLRELLRAKPTAKVNYQLGLAQTVTGNYTNAVAALRQAVALQPDFVDALNDLAWTLATAPDPNVRRPDEALTAAMRACELTTNRVARYLGTLDAAYAAAGQFPQAIATAQRVVEMAQAMNDAGLAKMAGERLKFYQAGQPYFQSFAPPNR